MKLGFLSLETKKQDFFQQMALVASDYGIQCFRFTPQGINPETDQCAGERFDHDLKKWISEEFPLPRYLYDRCYYGEDTNSRQARSITQWLKSREDLVFLGYGLPNKWKLYETIKEDPTLAPYLPPTHQASTINEVLRFLKEEKKIVLKPANGSHGHGIYVLTLQYNTIKIQTQKRLQAIQRTYPITGDWTKWLSKLIEKKTYLMQPFLSLTNAYGQPYDVRIFFQKDERGEWIERGKGVRVGNHSSILSNLHAGASVSLYKDWLETIPISKRRFLHEEINDLARIVPAKLESAFFSLFELGLDIGVAKDYSIWLLDTNSKPGRNVILTLNPSMKETLLNAPLRFARYLHESGKSRKVTN